jgi:asparagine synthase (glutamine-hydrolysing)
MDEYLVKVDRLSMAHSLEVRVPLLDNDVVEWAAKFPMRKSSGSWTTKQPLRRLMKDRLPKMSCVEPNVALPPPWRNGWLALFTTGPNPCSAPVRVGRTNVIQPDMPRRLWLAEHTARRRDNSRRLWTIISYVLWSEKHGS